MMNGLRSSTDLRGTLLFPTDGYMAEIQMMLDIDDGTSCTSNKRINASRVNEASTAISARKMVEFRERCPSLVS